MLTPRAGPHLPPFSLKKRKLKWSIAVTEIEPSFWVTWWKQTRSHVRRHRPRRYPPDSKHGNSWCYHCASSVRKSRHHLNTHPHSSLCQRWCWVFHEKDLLCWRFSSSVALRHDNCWIVTSVSDVAVSPSSGLRNPTRLSELLDSEDGGTTPFRSASYYLPFYTASHHQTLHSSSTPLWKQQLSLFKQEDWQEN